jgi:hypothetical protein
MFGIIIDSKVICLLLEERIPDLYAHFVSIDMDLSLVFTRWFVCLLTCEVSQEISLRIWDLFFLRGPKMIFRTILAIF